MIHVDVVVLAHGLIQVWKEEKGLRVEETYPRSSCVEGKVYSFWRIDLNKCSVGGSSGPNARGSGLGNQLATTPKSCRLSEK